MQTDVGAGNSAGDDEDFASQRWQIRFVKVGRGGKELGEC